MFERTYRGPLKAVILDWAGTIVDYGCCAPAAVFVEVFRRKGVAITMEQARGPMGLHKRAHIEALAKVDPVASLWREAHGAPCGAGDVEEMFRDFVPLQMACLAQYADLIPGTLEAVGEFRRRGIKIGATTGYTREMLDVLLEEASRRGFTPDCAVSSTEVPAGRPHPWMCFEAAKRLELYPMEAFVKIGDTTPDVHEGLNAGMWTIAVAKTGNEVGLTEAEIAALDRPDLDERLERARRRLREAGAHYVVDSIADTPPVLDEINGRLARGERPA